MLPLRAVRYPLLRLAALGLLAAVLLASGIGQASGLGQPGPGRLVVGAEGPYFTLAEALAAAQPGDTIEVRARIWLDLDLTTRVRLAGIDAPEMVGGCPEERRLAELARDRLAALLGGGPVRLADIQRDKYGGRVVAEVLLADGRRASEAMLASGVAALSRASGGWC